MRPAHRRLAATFAATALLLAGCAGGSSQEPDAGPTDEQEAADQELAVLVASYDVAVGEDRRLLAGILTADAAQVAFGEATFELGHLGEEPSGNARIVDEVTATYLPVPGMAPGGEPTEQATVLVGESGSGVYEATVDLEDPGYYGLRVTVELEDGTTRQGQATFEVLPEPQVPDVGDEAPRSENLTIADVEAGDAPAVALDSLMQDEDAEVPHPILHDSTVAGSLDEGTPVVAILATPTYCVSTFCGPLTTEMAALAEEHADTADFIHIEVWRDFEAAELNPSAAEWIQTEAGGNEPWVFLVDGDGIVRARWDNVVDVDELEEQLAAL